MDYVVMHYLNNNINLFDDNQFIKEIFRSYCINSNNNMVMYLCENNSILNNGLFNSTYYIDTLTLMCKKSTCSIVKWYYEKFFQSIDLSNITFIFESIHNQDTDVFKYILSISKNFYSQNQYERIFLYCIKNFYIKFVKLIYNEFPNINLMIINGISLHNSLDIYTPLHILNWLKEIAYEKSFEINVNIDNTININRIINIYRIDKKLIDELKRLNINLVSEECVVCFENQTNVITNCGHKFCIGCIKSWCKKNYSCPICRNSDNKIKFYWLIDN